MKVSLRIKIFVVIFLLVAAGVIAFAVLGLSEDDVFPSVSERLNFEFYIRR